MHAAQVLAVLALAGQTLAAPWNPFWNNNGGNSGAPAQNDVAVVTMYTTITVGGPTAAHHRTTATAAPQQPQTTVAAQPTAAPATPAPSSVAAPPSSGSSGSGYMATVNDWRSKMGLSQLTQSDQLQANALKTTQDGNGQMVHELNPGTFAQVLAPGSSSDFENVFVGGWLCEMPNLPGLDGICGSMSKGWSYDGQTGHAEILSSTKYSKIGCALADGIWGCDLA